MRLYFINIDTHIPVNREIHTIMPAIIFSDSPVIYASTVGTLPSLMESDLFKKNPKLMLGMFKAMAQLNLSAGDVDDIVQKVEAGLKLEHKKMRNKFDFQMIAATRKMLKTIEEQVYGYFKWTMERFFLERINPFSKGEKIILTSISKNEKNYKADENNTQNFVGMTTVPGDFFICTEHILEGTTSAELINDAIPQNFSSTGMLSARLLNLPGCAMLKYGKLSLLQEELQPQLKQWQQSFDKLQVELSEMDFTSEQAQSICTKVHQHITADALPLQKKTGDSIYISQLANGEMGECTGSLSLVVCSYLSFYNALKNTSQLSDNVYESLVGYLNNNKLGDKCFLFLMHAISSYPPERSLAHEEIEPLWEQSFQ